MSSIRQAIKSRSKSKDKLLTPLIVKFMNENELFNFDDETIRLAMSILKKEREERRSDLFHPSSSSSCMRKQVLDYMGYPSVRDEDLQLMSIFDDGKWRHLRWHLLLHRVGISEGIEKFVSSSSLKRVGGTPDQILNLSKHYPWSSGLRIGFEMKGTHTDRYNSIIRTNRPIFDHLYQVITYMVLEDLDLYVIIYENKNDQNFYEFDILSNKIYNDKIDNALLIPKLWKKYIIARYTYMNRCVEKMLLPACECVVRKGDVKFSRCSQKANCLKVIKTKEIGTAVSFPNQRGIEEKLYKSSAATNFERNATFTQRYGANSKT